MKNAWGMLSLSLVFGGPASAVVGDAVQSVRAKDAPSVCQITIGGSEIDELCSGTLISPNRVVTAGHCFGREFSLRQQSVDVKCGDHYLGSVQQVTIPDPNDDSLWLNDKEPARASDVAFIDLKRPTNLTPAPMAANADVFFKNTSIRPEAKCWIMGFGIDNSGNAGSLHQASLDELAINFFDHPQANLVTPLIYLSDRGTTGLSTSGDRGDSGGPLFCQLPGSQAELVGVIGGYNVDSNTGLRNWNYLNPIWLHVPNH